VQIKTREEQLFLIAALSAPDNSKLETCLASGEVEHANVASIVNATSRSEGVKARQAYNLSQ
jgi:hypothetical protein